MCTEMKQINICQKKKSVGYLKRIHTIVSPVITLKHVTRIKHIIKTPILEKKTSFEPDLCESRKLFLSS